VFPPPPDNESPEGKLLFLFLFFLFLFFYFPFLFLCFCFSVFFSLAFRVGLPDAFYVFYVPLRLIDSGPVKVNIFNLLTGYAEDD